MDEHKNTYSEQENNLILNKQVINHQLTSILL